MTNSELRAEADKLLEELEAVDPRLLRSGDDAFIGRMREGNTVTPTQLEILTGIRNKYL